MEREIKPDLALVNAEPLLRTLGLSYNFVGQDLSNGEGKWQVFPKCGANLLPGCRSVAELKVEGLKFIRPYPLKERKKEWVN